MTMVIHHFVPEFAVQYWLDRGADINITNKNGQTAFNFGTLYSELCHFRKINWWASFLAAGRWILMEEVLNYLENMYPSDEALELENLVPKYFFLPSFYKF